MDEDYEYDCEYETLEDDCSSSIHNDYENMIESRVNREMLEIEEKIREIKVIKDRYNELKTKIDKTVDEYNELNQLTRKNINDITIECEPIVLQKIRAELKTYLREQTLATHSGTLENSKYFGIEFEPNSDQLNVLSVVFNGFDETTPLGASLMKYSEKSGYPPCINLQLEITGEFHAPFLWVKSPLLETVAKSEFGLMDGAICIDGLTMGGYRFTGIGDLLAAVRPMMAANLIVKSSGTYTRESAIAGKTRIETYHGSWKQ